MTAALTRDQALELAPGLVDPRRPCVRRYVPHLPHPKQAALLLMANEREVLFGGAAGGGKALPIATPIPTPAGWTTIGELRPGDPIFGERGQVIRVTHAHPVDLAPESWRLAFDDGTSMVASGDHRWWTFDSAERTQAVRRTSEFRANRQAERPRRGRGVRPDLVGDAQRRTPVLDAPPGSIRTTREIAATLRDRRGRPNHAVPVADPIELPPADLPVDPYLLGVWLGDGTTAAASVTSADPEIFAAFDGAYQRGRTDVERGAARTVSWLGLRADLRAAGVFGDKHVPAAYMRASVGQRLALLQGLMDSDGWCNRNGTVEFVNTNERLARAVAELAASLGDRPRIRRQDARLNGRRTGDAWRVKWTSRHRVFRLARKAAGQRLGEARTRRRLIVAADRVASTPMRCITVDNPTGVFLAGPSFLPTHNSDALLMDALQYVCVPGYAAVLLRQNYPMLAREDGLIPRAEEWLATTDAVWRAVDKRWEFPSGASLTLAAAQRDEDRFSFAGPAYQFAGFDELTNWRTLKVYLYVGFSRLRQPERDADLRACPNCGLTLADVPLRTRATTNPGGPGHDAVEERFVTPWEAWRAGEAERPERLFLRARLSDNPSLNQESYLAGLRELDPIEQARLIEGDWKVRESGGMFARAKFIRTDSRAPAGARRVRYWDFAATPPSAANRDPDWTVGALIAHHDGWWWVEHVARLRDTPAKVEQRVRATAELDGRSVPVVIEQEPGASGVRTVQDFARRVLPAGWECHGDKATGSKIERARGWSAAVGNDLAHIVAGSWDVGAFLDEHEEFPTGGHDDQVDACAGGVNWLASRTGGMRYRP